MYLPLLKSHSGLRWIFLLLFILALVYLYQSAFRGKDNKKAILFSRLTLIVGHIQLLIGLVLYFISPKVIFMASSMKETLTRFYLVEHISLMFIAVILMTIAFSKNKNFVAYGSKGKKLFYLYSISLMLIIISIPWPFRNLGAGWF